MPTIFFEGMLLGLGAAVPIGPVNILIMSYALRSYGQALAVGLGAMSADVVYLFLMTFGLLRVLDEPWIMQVLAVFGFLFLLVIAIMVFKGAGKHLHVKKVKPSSFVKLYIKGLFITMFNPYTVGFWLSVASLALSKDSGFTLMLLGMMIAILIWVMGMPYIIHLNKHLISDNMAKYFAYFSGIVLSFFSCMLFFNTFILE